ncbi:glycoside hydrolase family 75 protein [Streptomyces sp. NPDC056987]|uniref:glycoside hydrolase family 75 protein n=1 Tax=Streptomyces sp. NPDC056987 TaxID=3345988 RepID=UPI00363844AA
MHSRTHVLITAGTALLAAAVVPATVLPALAVPTAPLPAPPRTAEAPTAAPSAKEPSTAVRPGAVPSAPTPLAAPPPAARSATPPAAARSATRAPAPQGAAGPSAENMGSAESAESTESTESTVSAAALMARAERCDQVSNGLYRTREDTPPTVAVCDTRGAVFWKADMDIDCDGQLTARCNHETDPYYQEQTAFTQSDGRHLNAEKLPYIVVPMTSSIWDHASSGIHGGSLAAVIHGDTVQYAVVGDVGPPGIIGEASHAAARGLGILTDPARGGVASGVTYIVFKHSQVAPIEDHDAAVRLGDELARKFLRDN